MCDLGEERIFEQYQVGYGNSSKEGGVYVALNGDVYVGRGGAILRMVRGSRELETYAGRVGSTGYVDGERLEVARFSAVGGMSPALGGGPGLVICDRSNHMIRIVEGNEVATYAGKGKRKGFRDGPRMDTEWSWPNDVVLHGDVLYVADYGNNRIRMIGADGMVSSIGNGKEKSVDGAIGSEDTSFKCPFDLCIVRGNLYVSEQLSHCIRKISWRKGIVTTLTGKSKDNGYKDGHFDEASFHYPKGLDATPNGDLIVADYANHVIRLLSLSDKTVKTLVWGHKKNPHPNPSTPSLDLFSPSPSLADSTSHPPSTSSTSDLTPQTQTEQKKTPQIPSSVSSFGSSSSFETPSEPYFVAVSPFGDLIWTPTTPHLYTIVELFPSSTNRSIRAPNMRFSDLFQLPTLCDSSVTFEHPISGTTPLHSPQCSQTDLSFPPSNLHDTPYSASISSQTIHLQSELLNCIHPTLGQNNRFLERLAKSRVPGRVIDFLGMIFDSHFLNNETFTAFALYFCSLADLSPKTAPFARWALSAFSTSIHFLRDVPPLMRILEDTCINLEANKHVVRAILAQATKSSLTTFLLEKMDASPIITSSSKDIVHQIHKKYLDEDTTLSPPEKDILRATDVLTSGLRQLASQLVFVDSPALPSISDLHQGAQSPNTDASFYIGIDSLSPQFKVHAWILYLKWPYFSNLMASGFRESVEKKITLPSDFPPSLLLCALQFMYCRRVLTPPEHTDDLSYLIANGAQFGFLEMDGQSSPVFDIFLSSCCSKLIAPLQNSNCLEQLSLRISIGHQKWIDGAVQFIGRNLPNIVKTEIDHASILSYPEPIKSAIFDACLRACYK